jgi:hypothetical protein
MSSLLRLYPQAWRARYGDELLALLQDRPASVTDYFDLIRGALDARLHPQVPGAAAVSDKELPVNQRSFGFLAAAGGIIWILAILSMFVLPRDAEGSRSLGLAMVGMALAMAFIGAALGDLGTRRASATSERTGRLVIVVSLALGLTLVIAWPIFLFGLFGFPILAALLAIRGTRNGVFPTWFAVVASIAALGVLGGIGVDMQAGRDQTLALIAVVGVPALLLAGLALRGTPLSSTSASADPA